MFKNLFFKIKKITFLSSFFVLLLFNNNKIFSAPLAIELGRIKTRISELTTSSMATEEKAEQLITLINTACSLLEQKQTELKSASKKFSLDEILFSPVLKCVESISDSGKISSDLESQLEMAIKTLEKKIKSLGRKSDHSECTSFARQVRTSCSCFSSTKTGSSSEEDSLEKELLFAFINHYNPMLVPLIKSMAKLEKDSADLSSLRTLFKAQLDLLYAKLEKEQEFKKEQIESLRAQFMELLKKITDQEPEDIK